MNIWLLAIGHALLPRTGIDYCIHASMRGSDVDLIGRSIALVGFLFATHVPHLKQLRRLTGRKYAKVQIGVLMEKEFHSRSTRTASRLSIATLSIR